jgi:hypothetical protein
VDNVTGGAGADHFSGDDSPAEQKDFQNTEDTIDAVIGGD